MPGKTKRKYQAESIKLNKKLKRPIISVKEILPKEYDINKIVEELKKYYPFEWKELNERYLLYKEKDNFLKRVGKRERYKPLTPIKYISSLPKVKHILSERSKEEHRKNFNKDLQTQKIKELEQQRNKKIDRIRLKQREYKRHIQEIEPLYVDVFIAAYHKRGISIDEKIEIFNELKKYETKKTIDFFYKLNDAERNNQIRDMAFKHLQSLGKYVKKRGGFKGKKKVYMIEKSDFNMTPLDLWNKINKNDIQSNKTYDVFLSHSLKDSDLVLNTIKCLNKIGLNVYCDWTSDNDFLKRSLVSDYTKMVLKMRLKQSKNLLLLVSKNSIVSNWVKFELDCFSELNKPIYYIKIDNIPFDKGKVKKFTELQYNFKKNYIQHLK